jgi:hypothetical protein
MTLTPDHFKELLARARANALENQQANIAANADAMAAMIEKESPHAIDITNLCREESPDETVVEIIQDILGTPDSSAPATKTIGVARDVELNAKQYEFYEFGLSGIDCCLIGAAGTGKTTSMRKFTAGLIKYGLLPAINSSTKWFSIGSPGAMICSFTNKAVNNIRHAVVPELKKNTLTIHKALDFAPVFYEIEDKAGEIKKTMAFEPSRTRFNPLPSEIVFVAFEESSMIPVELYNMLQDAMPHPHQEVFLGDIQQLPPVFGSAVLGFKMLQLPVIELTEVYRQALDSPIIDLAWKILAGKSSVFSGKTESYKVFSEYSKKEVTRIRCPALEALTHSSPVGELKFQPWQKTLTPDDALNTISMQLRAWIQSGYYDPQEDMILCPFNKAFGTVEINKQISQYLGVTRQATVHEVVAGFNKHYLAIGDRVLYDKEDAFIVNISKNGKYLGAGYQPASVHLSRYGNMQSNMTEAEEAQAEADQNAAATDEAMEFFLNSAVESSEDRVQACSHVITVKYAYDMESHDMGMDSDDGVVLDSAAEINNLLGGYAITVHKSQGSEFNKVFILLHASHATMISRELLYTAVTRAKKYLHIIAETTTFQKGIQVQRIKGSTLEEKAEFFKGKLDGGVFPTQEKLNIGGRDVKAMMAEFERSSLPPTLVSSPAEELCPAELCPAEPQINYQLVRENEFDEVSEVSEAINAVKYEFTLLSVSERARLRLAQIKAGRK